VSWRFNDFNNGIACGELINCSDGENRRWFTRGNWHCCSPSKWI